jgi:hypothetical protein
MRLVLFSLALVACGLVLVFGSFGAAGGHDRDRGEVTGWYALCWTGLALSGAGAGVALLWTVRRPRPRKVGAFAALGAVSLASLWVGVGLALDSCGLVSLGCTPEPPDAFTRASEVLLAIGLGLVPACVAARFVCWFVDEANSAPPAA